ncbi:hypothetical protein TREMEDRAFT_71010 [Tremella mesenterica DSM 1558]|uniref:uncharacterized protein n=1 Tax=Tremella mesenterica (strain ATCC 24925 / CBS 8224 / DSM 1558 / NBRC 9311 / NRRL Y-6157 / RJB 2259-6 / UBC 559-6) TaxID=578456 RepID=UPI0003F4A153|nr:uncharacterized protein TREMEDRAFT_71010 [Tremella mesenterica DSM 1558]EIW73623.1 hypothetical protein TREMEDRAFT_71010 [Tremella mesenterica DSM 1558]
MSDTFQLAPQIAELPLSILDTDLYKLTMQNAVLHHFPDAVVVFRFTNRNPAMLFSRECFNWILEHVNKLSTVSLTPAERSALSAACPYFPDTYLDFLTSLRLNPQEEVVLTFHPETPDGKWGKIECVIRGLWRVCILYEVPIMSIDKAKRKALDMLSPPTPITPLVFSEFGTRRRRSFHVHDLVIRGLIEGTREHAALGKTGGALAGTSNVYLALKYGVKPSGTIAHEWIMAIGAIFGYKGANGRAMDMWEEVYPRDVPEPAPLTMLTDTFTAQAFFVDFIASPSRALRWGALRQDSGDPFTFAGEAKQAYAEVEKLAGVDNGGVVAKGKRVVFSDGLDVEKAIALQKVCDEIGMSAAFGIGTSLTNDFMKASDPSQVSKPLNIVIKLSEINGLDCVKLSDDKGKSLYQYDTTQTRLISFTMVCLYLTNSTRAMLKR